MENKIAWEKYPEGNKREEVFQFAENYRKFISDCKTERECVTSFVEKAEKAGFVNLEKVIAEHTALKAGDRVYANNMGKRHGFICNRKREHGKRNEYPWSTH